MTEPVATGAPVEVRVLRVFLGADGTGGNELGIVLDAAAIPVPARQAIAARLGYSETVFLEDPATGRIRIHTPAAELAFAGHPTVGTAWLLRRELGECERLRPPAGDVPTWEDAERCWIRARPEWIHPITTARLASAADVDALDGPPAREDSWYAWAWIDDAAGILRSRYFAPAYGIPEDQATGAAAVMMGGRLGRSLEIRQGRGSFLSVRPGPDGSVELGGRVVAAGIRTVEP
jgi:predicted PhzF superfamily epimerase YddE/YHI9